MKRLVIAIHDIAPSTGAAAERLRVRVGARVAGPVSLLVVPRYHGRESLRSGRGRGWLAERVEDGDELVLHGYSHADRSGRDGRELSGRPDRAVHALIADGVAEMREAGLDPAGFIAPSYVHPPAADAGCRRAGLPWWATRRALRSAAGSRPLPSIGLGASSGARRALSPLAAAAAARALAPTSAVRLDLHPADLVHRRLDRAIDDLIDRLLAQGRRPVTHATLGTSGAGVDAAP